MEKFMTEHHEHSFALKENTKKIDDAREKTELALKKLFENTSKYSEEELQELQKHILKSIEEIKKNIDSISNIYEEVNEDRKIKLFLNTETKEIEDEITRIKNNLKDWERGKGKDKQKNIQKAAWIIYEKFTPVSYWDYAYFEEEKTPSGDSEKRFKIVDAYLNILNLLENMDNHL